MAVMNYNRTTPTSSIVSGRMAKAVMALVATVLDWNDSRKTRAALSKLSNRELDDIGLSRGDIDVVAQSGMARF